MKKLLLALAFLLIPAAASAQCTGVFPANTVCGNLSGVRAPPKPTPAGGGGGGGIIGPVTSVVGDVATWGNVSGSVLFDTTPSAVIDEVCSTDNATLIRLTGTWQCGATVGTAGRGLIDQGSGAAPAFVAMSGSCTINSAGVISCTGSAVSSVTNSDSTLTISPTTGAVIASLNPAHANTWSAVQTFNANDLVLGSVTGIVQCLHASSGGVVTGTGTDCGGSGAITSLLGDVTGTGPGATSTSVVKIAGVSVGTPTGTGNVVFSNAPTIATPTFTGVSTFGGAIKVPVRTAVTATDSISATTDYFVCPLNTSVAATENLPAGANGLTFLVKDCGGNASTHSITIMPISPTTIDGVSLITLTTNYQSLAVTYSGSQWSGN